MTPDYGPLNEWINRRANGAKPTVRTYDGCWYVVGRGVRGTSFNPEVAWTLWHQAVRHTEEREKAKDERLRIAVAWKQRQEDENRQRVAMERKARLEREAMEEKVRMAKAKQVEPITATKPLTSAQFEAHRSFLHGEFRDVHDRFRYTLDELAALKAQLIDMKADLIKWIVGISLGFFAAGLTAMGLFVQFWMAK